jgi:hypothetical protein
VQVIERCMPIEAYLLSGAKDTEAKLRELGEGRARLDPFSTSRDIYLFRDFTADAPSVYLFPRLSFINEGNFYVGMYNKFQAMNGIGLNFENSN